MPSVVVSEPLISSISTHGPLEAGRGGTARREGQGAVSRRKGGERHAEAEGDRREAPARTYPFLPSIASLFPRSRHRRELAELSRYDGSGRTWCGTNDSRHVESTSVQSDVSTIAGGARRVGRRRDLNPGQWGHSPPLGGLPILAARLRRLRPYDATIYKYCHASGRVAIMAAGASAVGRSQPPIWSHSPRGSAHAT